MRHAASVALFLSVFLLAMLAESPSYATLSARSAFTLLEKVPPGEYYADARNFLGLPSAERVVDIGDDIKITRWGKAADTWIFEVLHDDEVVRATRITWRTKTKSEQQTIFSQLTTVGRKFFGITAKFKGMDEAQWDDFGGRWIVRARLEDDLARGVTLLSGIRDSVMGSDRFGF
jgi:hypothetical protein